MKRRIRSNELMRNIDELFAALARSRFRSSRQLDARDSAYLKRRGIDTIMQHAGEFLAERLAPAFPANDGKQTPWRGHPAFTAQHATGTCCRSCLSKWHNIPKGTELPAEQMDYLLRVIRRWLNENAPPKSERVPHNRTLWPNAD